MINSIPPELTIGSFSLVGLLTGYIWNSQGKRIARIEITQTERPCSLIAERIAEIKTDIRWIKKNLK